jgi:hypothetical protein
MRCGGDRLESPSQSPHAIRLVQASFIPYRPGYLDLCRLYTTSELIDWFGHIADASEELRRDFDLMAQSGSTPMEYGLRVQSHPSLMVTSQVKMRAARNLMISFSGETVETVTFRVDSQTVSRNFQALQTLLSQLSNAEEDPVRQRNGSTEKWQGYVWKMASSPGILIHRVIPKPSTWQRQLRNSIQSSPG